ncbi:MAG TPA: response regulator [Polyangia bacterium]|nr:response regulator [Polyangia bacterium]
MSEPGAILLVDDDEVFRERLARALRDRGHPVVTAGDGPSALAAAGAQKFDFAVLDLRMPGPTGLSLIGPVRETAPGVRIVVLTGYGSITSAVEALRAGAHDYLSKPVDADQVIGALTGEPVHPAEAAAPSLARAEWEHIQRVLADCHQNISEASRRLGITRRTLQLKLKKYPPRV